MITYTHIYHVFIFPSYGILAKCYKSWQNQQDRTSLMQTTLLLQLSFKIKIIAHIMEPCYRPLTVVESVAF